ncbi:hypothetical protein GWI33_009854 [Rhynchophorus ferrugineus]|uniref:Uncharacterized protein n=1 Tax=Rhynchophorus ferrugineus TaxID=354439 RepID=A0A834I936_RHYFE|nr:hypothetical protein GWI33_009854 [Rhynchophorus ferrugineus]
MGVEINAQENPQSKYVRSVHTMCKIVVERAFNPLKTNDFLYNFTLDNIAERKAVKYLHSTADAVIKMKREEQQKEEEEENDDVGGKKRVAFLDLLLRHRDENGQPLSDKCIRKQVNTIMFAIFEEEEEQYFKKDIPAYIPANQWGLFLFIGTAYSTLL